MLSFLYNYENIYNEIKLKWNNEHVKTLGSVGEKILLTG